MKNIKLEIVVFLCGAVVMILEMVGSRVMAPYLGTSLFVWTSLIGIILASLSCGYWWGGKLADKNPNYVSFAAIIFVAALVTGVMNVLRTPFLEWLHAQIRDIRTAAVVSATILFSVPSVLMGMISPYAARLRVQDLSTSGATIGRLYAISTIGSIFGTFFSGFFLISYLGTTKIIYLLVAVMIATSVLAYSQSWAKSRVLLAAAVFLTFPATDHFHERDRSNGVVDIDTDYSRILIVDDTDPASGRPTRTLYTSPMDGQSVIYLDGDDLFANYLRFYDFAEHLVPGFENALMIGGGTGSYAKHFLKKFGAPRTLDVVEIDPDFTAIAKRHFGLVDDPRIRIFHEDARTYLNDTDKKYDVIFSDVFKANSSIPYQLVTRESVRNMYDALNDGGVVMANVVTALEGEWADFLKVAAKTYGTVFPQVHLFRVDEEPEWAYQSVVLVAVKASAPIDFDGFTGDGREYANKLLAGNFDTDLEIFTDDYAPVDRYMLTTPPQVTRE